MLKKGAIVSETLVQYHESVVRYARVMHVVAKRRDVFWLKTRPLEGAFYVGPVAWIVRLVSYS